jgi:hypothetical protein
LAIIDGKEALHGNNLIYAAFDGLEFRRFCRNPVHPLVGQLRQHKPAQGNSVRSIIKIYWVNIDSALFVTTGKTFGSCAFSC